MVFNRQVLTHGAHVSHYSQEAAAVAAPAAAAAAIVIAVSCAKGPNKKRSGAKEKSHHWKWQQRQQRQQHDCRQIEKKNHWKKKLFGFFVRQVLVPAVFGCSLLNLSCGDGGLAVN